MLHSIVFVMPLGGYMLFLRFQNGVAGKVNVKELVEFTGVFEPLNEEEYFLQAKLNLETGTVQWPNEADLDPEVLYQLINKE